MPIVTVNLYPGRSLDQKRALVRSITNAMIEHADAKPNALHVILQEIPKEDWSLAGVLGVDREDRDHKANVMESRVRGLAHLLMQVSDLSRAERFYVDILGFTVRKREPFAGGRHLIVTNQGLGLTEGGPGDGRQVEHFAFEVQNVDAIARRARDAGVTILKDLCPGIYGRTVYLADPDGNKIELFEPESKQI